MPDGLRAPVDGPNGAVSTELAPSRGQHQAIATLALELLDLKQPTTRFGASVTIAQLRMALERKKAAAA